MFKIDTRHLCDGTCEVHIDKDPNVTLHFNSKYKPWKYVNDFMKLKCSLDVLPMVLGTGDISKEISEIMGFWNAIRKNINIHPGDSEVDVFVVGDGNTPRLGAFIACMSRWNVVSIDPRMKNKNWGIKRLITFSFKFEDVIVNYFSSGKKAIILLPHAHVNAEEVLLKFGTDATERHLISSPCCEPNNQLLNKKPEIFYRDTRVLSIENKMYVWRNV